MNKLSVIIVSGGKSTRMEGVDKQTTLIGGLPVIIRSIIPFDLMEEVLEIVLCVNESNKDKIEELVNSYPFVHKITVVIGGETRQNSVLNGVRALENHPDFIAIHDGARPFVEKCDIERTLKNAEIYGGSALFVPVKDTVKEVENGYINKTLDRNKLYNAQTPQIFRACLYKKALRKATDNNQDFTDDCALFENIGEKVFVTVGNYDNIKITTKSDLKLGKSIVGDEVKMRIGHGYDVHKLVENRKLILGGVEIPYEKGLLGHSDADVLVHSVMDGILGALSLGDIGKLFPDNDENYKDANSINLLMKVREVMSAKGYEISNLDCTVVAQNPKLAPFIISMRENIAKALLTDIENVSVKATTEEKLGFTGDGSGISSTCVCLLKNI